MKKVALVTCYFKYNFGSQLQAYATQDFLLRNGIECENIDVSKLIDFKKGKKKFYRSQLFNFNFLKTKSGMVKMVLRKKVIKDKLTKNLNLRAKTFNAFEKEHFIMSRKYNTYDELNKMANDRYSDFIVGSDQLWLPVNVVADYFTLNFVPNEINKISYSTSMGISFIPDKYKEKYGAFLRRINHVSVREEKTVELLKNNFEIDAKLVCDPTMLLTNEEWLENVDLTRKYKEKYILCYFLGKTIEHKKFAERLAQKTGCKIVSLNNCDERDKYSDKFADYSPYDVSPFDWINLIYNAEYICTDSFHGTVFSILNNKNFFTFNRYNSKNKLSTNSRISTLLKKFDFENRLFNGSEDITDELLNDLNFDNANSVLAKYREDSKTFLLNSIVWKKETPIRVDELLNHECCGCSSCYNACPKNAINMETGNDGFVFPKIDEKLCVNCGICAKKCPSINKKVEMKNDQYAFLIQSKNEEVLKQSTSGGAFTAIAEKVIEAGGVVFGAAFNENFEVIHKFVENKDELKIFRNSKYVQSRIGDSYKKVKELLNSGKLVYFSGTPCQIEGLHAFLGRDYDNLILQDIVCHSVPSPKIWEMYKEYVTNGKQNEINYVAFRDKQKYGYQYSQMRVDYSAKVKQNGIDSDKYLRPFFNDLSIRNSCYECKFKKRYRVSDITLWDCFDAYKFDKSFDDNRGVTRALVHTKKGLDLISKIENCKVHEIKADDAIYRVNELIRSTTYNHKREEFFKDANELEPRKFFRKWAPDTLKVKFERFVRHTTEKLGLYRPIKKLVRRILGK